MNDKKKNIFLVLGLVVISALCIGLVYYANSKDEKKVATENSKQIDLNKIDLPQLSNEVAKDEAEVKMETEAGDITIKLFPKEAPLAVENFLTLSKKGYYNNDEFFRVIKQFMIQSGDPDNNGTGGKSIWNGKDSKIDSGKGFKNEISASLYNIRGALAMANAGADTNGSQFFIVQNSENQSDGLLTDDYPEKIIEAYKKGGAPTLDGNYTVFGQVLSGMEVVDKIATAKVKANSSGEESSPENPIKIKKIEVLKDYDFSK